MRAVLNFSTPHYAFIGERGSVEIDVEEVGIKGKGIVHELYQAEIALLQTIKFWLYGRNFSFAIQHCFVECPVYVGNGPWKKIYCDNLLWLNRPCEPFGPLSLFNIEVQDTHKTTEEKISVLQRAGIPTIELKTGDHIFNNQMQSDEEINRCRDSVKDHLYSLGRVKPLTMPKIKNYDLIPSEWLG